MTWSSTTCMVLLQQAPLQCSHYRPTQYLPLRSCRAPAPRGSCRGEGKICKGAACQTYLMPTVLLTPVCQVRVKAWPPTCMTGMVTNSTPACHSHNVGLSDIMHDAACCTTVTG